MLGTSRNGSILKNGLVVKIDLILNLKTSQRQKACLTCRKMKISVEKHNYYNYKYNKYFSENQENLNQQSSI